MKICEEINCKEKYYAKNRCRRHYGRIYMRMYNQEYKQKPGKREKYQEYNRKYRQTKKAKSTLQKYYNRKDIKKRRNTRDKIRRDTDIQYRLAINIRGRIFKVIKRKQKAGSAIKDLECSLSHFKLYIENQFEENMSWGNYGKWHLDHITPLSAFDLTNRMEFLMACNWLNYQPLWAEDNIRKGGL